MVCICNRRLHVGETWRQYRGIYADGSRASNARGVVKVLRKLRKLEAPAKPEYKRALHGPAGSSFRFETPNLYVCDAFT